MQQMQHWQSDADFAGVRGSEALERLPAAERADWQKLWQEVEELRHRAAPPADKNQPKNEGLRRFRPEAAELLGIEKKKD
jgi:hypothetical protein